jgi:hypothetical protein
MTCWSAIKGLCKSVNNWKFWFGEYGLQIRKIEENFTELHSRVKIRFFTDQNQTDFKKVSYNEGLIWRRCKMAYKFYGMIIAW